MKEFDDLKADVAELKKKTASSLNAIVADVDRMASKPSGPTPDELKALSTEIRGVIDSLGVAESVVDNAADSAAGQDDVPPTPPVEG